MNKTNIWQFLDEVRERLLVTMVIGALSGVWLAAFIFALGMDNWRFKGAVFAFLLFLLLWVGPGLFQLLRDQVLEFYYWPWVQTIRQRRADRKRLVLDKARLNANIETEKTRMAAEALQRRAEWEKNKKRSGQGVVEYAIIMAMVAVVIIVIIAVFNSGTQPSSPIKGTVLKAQTGVINNYSYGFITVDTGQGQLAAVTVPMNSYGFINVGDYCQFGLSSSMNRISGVADYVDQVACTPQKDR